ncbi:hypothetical protein D9M71_349060 [compost metagenome]
MSEQLKPVAWAPSAVIEKLRTRHNNAPCVLTDRPGEFNDVPLYALSEGCVVVPRELLRRVAFEVVGLEIASGLNADATDELRALLGKESEI